MLLRIIFSIKLTPSIPILQYLQNENANEFFWSIALLPIVFLRKSLWRRQLLSANLHSLYSSCLCCSTGSCRIHFLACHLPYLSYSSGCIKKSKIRILDPTQFWKNLTVLKIEIKIWIIFWFFNTKFCLWPVESNEKNLKIFFLVKAVLVFAKDKMTWIHSS